LRKATKISPAALLGRSPVGDIITSSSLTNSAFWWCGRR